MRKTRLFYVIDEYTNVERYCKKRGLIPYKFQKITLEGYSFLQVYQYKKGEDIYDALECDQCYSGYMVTLMRIPKLSYEALLHHALTTKRLDERAGAVGIILKEHPREFEQYLSGKIQSGFDSVQEKRAVKRLARFINEEVKESISYVWEQREMLENCQKIVESET